MPNDTGLPQNKKPPSTETADTSDSPRKGLFDSRIDVLLLGTGLFFLLINIAVFWGIDTRPNAWLFYLDMRYWHASVSIAVWVAALWIVLESTGILEDYFQFWDLKTLAFRRFLFFALCCM
jgi:hypothetical protein